MKSLKLITAQLFIPIALMSAIITSSPTSSASQLLLPGMGPIGLPGTTSAMEVNLAGVVIHDKLIPFRILAPTGALLFEGVLQNRIVKSKVDNDLHFYFRIRNTKPGLNGIIKTVLTKSFQEFRELLVDWSPDGLGVVHPTAASRTAAPGQIVKFEFDASQPMVSGKESRFFYLKPKAKKFDEKGQTRITLVTGESVTLNTVQPIR